MELFEELRRYRDEILEISQSEAALRLNVGQTTLSNYENGKRDIPYKMILKFKEVYKIPIEEMNRIMYGAQSNGNTANQRPMVLRESFEDAETLEILKILNEHPKLKRTLSSLQYFTDKRKEKFIAQVNHLFQTMKDW